MELDATAPSQARQEVRRAIAALGLAGDLADDIVLVTSELVTNAVEHGGGQCRFEVEHGDGVLTVRVYDPSPELPVPQAPKDPTPRGRGLWLVERLATAWGSEESADGKCVWARFVLP
jgi:anti-sigma regulatory factor (Ser/Thr protein kinase)